MPTKKFEILSEPHSNSNLQKQINEKKKEIQKKFKINESDLFYFFSLIEDSIKSSRTRIEDERKEFEWDDSMYVTLYHAVLKAHPDTIQKIVTACRQKFFEERAPINYLTAILRSGIEKQKKLDTVIEKDLNEIRTFMTLNKDNKNWLNKNLSSKFIELNLKVNRDIRLDSETKSYLNKRINELHRTALEWTQKK